jgi:hypothetical protein
MLLDELMKAVDTLPPEDLRQLRAYIQQREQEITLQAGTLDMEGLLQALELIREGLSDEEAREIEQAMNGEI